MWHTEIFKCVGDAVMLSGGVGGDSGFQLTGMTTGCFWV